MDEKCRKCGRPNRGDCLTPEGDDWECSFGQREEGVPTSKNIRDAFDNVVRTIARHTSDLMANVRKRMYNAARALRREPLGRN